MFTGASRTDADEAGAVDKINSTFEDMKVGGCNRLDSPPRPFHCFGLILSKVWRLKALPLCTKKALSVVIESNSIYAFIALPIYKSMLPSPT